jgi:hypothetical protein
MKNYLILFVSVLAFTFSTTINAQEKQRTQAVFNGFDGDTYSFATLGRSVSDSKVITFKDISADLLAQFDLKSDAFNGETFTVTYSVAMESIDAPDGTKQEVETYTLVSIAK